MTGEALPLRELHKVVTKATYEWLEAYEKEVLKEEQSLKEESTPNLFGDEEEDFGDVHVHHWASSSSNPDGYGGYGDGAEESLIPSSTKLEPNTIVVDYILSKSSGGHGDDLWAASRHIANVFADEEKCRDILSPCLLRYGKKKKEEEVVGSSSSSSSSNSGGGDTSGSSPPPPHPLLGLRFVELGAGAGVPSWTAQRCGAKVVATDQALPDRIRCMAEAGERNRKKMAGSLNADDIRVCPHDWGTPVEEEIMLPGEEVFQRFDVVLAADCLYMSDFHEQLLESIDRLMTETHGVALLPFALHGNCPEELVWGIVELAKAEKFGFEVEILEALQLTPQCSNMPTKRGLVNTIRLTRRG